MSWDQTQSLSLKIKLISQTQSAYFSTASRYAPLLVHNSSLIWALGWITKIVVLHADIKPATPPARALSLSLSLSLSPPPPPPPHCYQPLSGGARERGTSNRTAASTPKRSCPSTQRSTTATLTTTWASDKSMPPFLRTPLTRMGCRRRSPPHPHPPGNPTQPLSPPTTPLPLLRPQQIPVQKKGDAPSILIFIGEAPRGEFPQ